MGENVCAGLYIEMERIDWPNENIERKENNRVGALKNGFRYYKNENNGF